jgi:secreted trypsin-like serine protease
VVAFLGNYAGGSGIFLEANNTFYRVVGTGDVLDGKTVTGLSFGANSITGDYFSFIIAYNGNESAIYTTNLLAIPEPAVTGLCGGLAALAALCLRRSIRKCG